jgi:hypothetical protein
MMTLPACECSLQLIRRSVQERLDNAPQVHGQSRCRKEGVVCFRQYRVNRFHGPENIIDSVCRAVAVAQLVALVLPAKVKHVIDLAALDLQTRGAD